MLWKTSRLVPVPKKANPINDFRAVAIMLHLMKVLEKLVLAHVEPKVNPDLDPHQFALCEVRDAVI